MAERTDMSRVLATLAAAIVALALTWCFADQAHAVEEISEFDTHVSTTQAGGHPDVDYKVTWTSPKLEQPAVQLRGRPASSTCISPPASSEIHTTFLPAG